MKQQEIDELYSLVLKEKGLDNQLEKLEEELIEALSAIRMFRKNKGSWDHVIEELNDVEIVAGQIRYFNKNVFCQEELWQKIRLEKLNKFKDYLEQVKNLLF